MYQFLIAVRSNDGQQLQNDAGETTRSVVRLWTLGTFPARADELI